MYASIAFLLLRLLSGVKSNCSVVSLSETSTNNGLVSALFAPIHLMIFHHLPAPILLHVIFCQCAIDSPYGSRTLLCDIRSLSSLQAREHVTP